MLLYFLWSAKQRSRILYGMRKCRNWQTSKTKDLVSIALVWVQVPSSALINKVGSLIIQGFLFFVCSQFLGDSWFTKSIYTHYIMIRTYGAYRCFATIMIKFAVRQLCKHIGLLALIISCIFVFRLQTKRCHSIKYCLGKYTNLALGLKCL